MDDRPSISGDLASLGGTFPTGADWRQDVGEGATAGFMEGHLLGRGAMASVTDCVFPTALEQTLHTSDDLFLLRASLSTNVSYSTPHTGDMVFQSPGVVVCHIPRGLPLSITVSGGCRHSGVVLLLRASAFEEVFGLLDADLPLPMQAAIGGRNVSGTLATLPITAPIAALVTGLLQSPLRGALRRLQTDGKVRELVSLILQLIDESPAFAGKRPVRKRDIDLARDARDILAREYCKPPTIAELARCVGLNQNKLKALFPTLFNTTIHGFCIQRRMQEAQLLLLDGQLTIAQIAERVGYEHQSSFAAAFRAFSGMAAKDYRKQRAALVVPLKTNAR